MNRLYKTNGIDTKSRVIVNKKARELKYKESVFQKLSKREQTQLNIENLVGFVQQLDDVFSNVDYEKVKQILNPSHVFLGLPKKIIKNLVEFENYLAKKENYNLLNYHQNVKLYFSLFQKDFFQNETYQNFSRLKFKSFDEYFKAIEKEFLKIMPFKKVVNITIEECLSLDNYLDILFKKFEVLEKKKTLIDEMVDDFVNDGYYDF
jgi:hypothetical protein